MATLNDLRNRTEAIMNDSHLNVEQKRVELTVICQELDTLCVSPYNLKSFSHAGKAASEIYRDLQWYIKNTYPVRSKT